MKPTPGEYIQKQHYTTPRYTMRGKSRLWLLGCGHFVPVQPMPGASVRQAQSAVAASGCPVCRKGANNT